MYETKQGRTPRHAYYVSNANGRVYPALRNVPGFEDDNPADWRVATRDEVDAFLRGDTAPAPAPSGEMQLSAPVAQASVPSAIRLADDDLPAAPAAAVPVFGGGAPAPAPTLADPPPAPAAALTGISPAFQLPA